MFSILVPLSTRATTRQAVRAPWIESLDSIRFGYRRKLCQHTSGASNDDHPGSSIPLLPISVVHSPKRMPSDGGARGFGNDSIRTKRTEWKRHFPLGFPWQSPAGRNSRQQQQQNCFFSTASIPITSSSSSSLSSDDSDEISTDIPLEWKQMYDRLKAYHTTHHTTIVSAERGSSQDTELAQWVRLQRQQSRRLSPDQKQLLNELRFVWDSQEAKWLEHYERLCDYESTETIGDEDVREISSSDLDAVFEKRYQKDPRLSRWVQTQRQNYRRETISKKRVALLEQVDGFVWDVKEARWLEMVRRLRVYADRHGTCIVPQHHPEDHQLACWVSNQRQRKNQLSAERIAHLNALGFVWDVREDQWQKNYQKYKACFFPDHATADSKHLSPRPLIDWAIKQRRFLRQGTLAPHRKKLLDELVHPLDGSTFVWDPHAENWMEMYQQLVAFCHAHGHAMVPVSYHHGSCDENQDGEDANDGDTNDENGHESGSSSGGQKLGVWVANQRRAYKKTKGGLSAERKELLEAVGFVWDAPEARWEDHYQRLVDYQERFVESGGDPALSTCVPQHHPPDPPLAIWVKEQRQNYKHGVLGQERFEQLRALGFVWDASSSHTSSHHT